MVQFARKKGGNIGTLGVINMKENGVILFGSGKVAKRYIKILRGLGITIWFLVDNNQQNWGGSFDGIEIMPPSELYRGNARIIIANSCKSAITCQLEQMGLQERISPFIEIISDNYENHPGFCMKSSKAEKQNKKNRTIVIDNLYGTWGGAETWVHTIGEELKLRNNDVLIIGNNGAGRQFDNNELVECFDTGNFDSVVLLHQLIVKMYMLLPITLIDISSDYALWAACILKNYYHDEVKIISAVLNDNVSVHERQLDGRKYIDYYFCISTKLQELFNHQYGISLNHICYRAPFADYEEKFQKNYNLRASDPIQIGYACRLCKAQKRADMLPILIGKLEENKVNYQINIAGDGECQTEIREYIEQQNLTHKVKLYGFLKKAKMPEYWVKQDLYLNLSEYEGTSLTMLDAMSYCVVPVVTDVSGVNDFINNKINGLIYPVGDIAGIVHGISYLDKNRFLLQKYGDICRKRICEKCKRNTYIDYVETLINL